MRQLVFRLAVSSALVGAVLAVCLHIPGLHRATVALLLVLVIIGLAKIWGWLESLIAALMGSAGFVYYFLPPRRFHIQTLEDFLDVTAFVVTAIIAGQLVARSQRQRMRALEQESATAKLYRLVDALLDSGGAESTLPQLAEKLVEIFGASGVALYDKHSGRIFRSGPGAAAIFDLVLHETATSGSLALDAGSALSLAPVHHGGELVGSLGMCGVRLSEPLLSSIAGRVGLGLARLYAIEKTTEAEAARQSDELKSAMLDALAHEIRNPLNSVKLAATTLLSGSVGNELLKREMLTIIDEEANRMDRYIDETLNVARLEAHELDLKKEPQDLTRLVPAALQEMGTAAVRRPIQMRLPESLPAAECDKEMMVRVLKQLLNNALKYSPEGTPLTVAAEFTGTAVVIDVVDSGPGVPEDERERIFEKYYRGRAARSLKPGTGLGLSSAKSIMQAHGGEIWVTAAPGGGAAFHVSLPVTGAGQVVGAS